MGHIDPMRLPRDNATSNNLWALKHLLLLLKFKTMIQNRAITLLREGYKYICRPYGRGYWRPEISPPLTSHFLWVYSRDPAGKIFPTTSLVRQLSWRESKADHLICRGRKELQLLLLPRQCFHSALCLSLSLSLFALPLSSLSISKTPTPRNRRRWPHLLTTRERGTDNMTADQYCGSGSKLDPYSATLWIRMRIPNSDLDGSTPLKIGSIRGKRCKIEDIK